MPTTGQDIVDELLDAMSLDASSNPYSATRCLRHINRAIQIVAGKDVTSEGEQSVIIGPSTRKYTLATGTMTIQHVLLEGNPRGLEPITMREVVRLGLSDVTGPPSHYEQDASSILLYPKPESAGRLYIYAAGTPAKLTTLASIIYLPEPFLIAIPKYLEYELRKDEEGDYSQALADWSALLGLGLEEVNRKKSMAFAGPIRQSQSVVGPGFIRNE